MVISKEFVFNLTKNTSKQECPLGGFRLDFAENAGVTLNYCHSSKKYHFNRMLLQKSLKSYLSSGSLILRCRGAKSNPFSNILISASANTRSLRLKIVSDENYPVNLLSDVTLIFRKHSLTCSLIPWDAFPDPSKRFNKSSVCNIFPSTFLSKLACLLQQYEEFLAVEVPLQSLDGDVGC